MRRTDNMDRVTASVVEQCNGLSDEAVVVRVLDGETSLYEVLMRRHNERLYRTARAIVGDDGRAEDVMEQAYVTAYVRLRECGDNGGFAKWLTRILVDESLAALDRVRAPH